jgi:hypothetical protein
MNLLEFGGNINIFAPASAVAAAVKFGKSLSDKKPFLTRCKSAFALAHNSRCTS